MALTLLQQFNLKLDEDLSRRITAALENGLETIIADGATSTTKKQWAKDLLFDRKSLQVLIPRVLRKNIIQNQGAAVVDTDLTTTCLAVLNAEAPA